MRAERNFSVYSDIGFSAARTIFHLTCAVAGAPKAKGKAKGKGKATGKTADAGKPPVAPKKSPRLIPTKAPKCTAGHEETRSRYIVRFGPELPSKIFSYKGTGGGEKQAFKDARAWTKAECKKLGIEMPAKFR